MMEIADMIGELIEAGYSVTIQKTKHSYSCECRDFDPVEPNSVYGHGDCVFDAVLAACVAIGICK